MVDDSTMKEINGLKEERNAIILGHNYELPEVQDVADFVGDSLGLSRKAADTDAEVIVFCGVYFMAETAAILCPDKTVLIPEEQAGCAMVDMAPEEKVKELKERHPDAAVVSYVNSSAAVKAISDYCCTSANAVDVVRSIDPDRPVIFAPDQYLGSYVQEQTGRDLILFDGYCPTHARLLVSDIERMREMYPDAEVMVHPECRPEVRRAADFVGSTGGMVRRAAETDATDIVVGTELGMAYRLRKDNPDKNFYIISEAAICPTMKMIDTDKILRSLREMQHEVVVPEETRQKALKAVERMVEAVRT